jgi:hypothetical protein
LSSHFQDRLEDVLAVMTELKREKFLSALLSRNGDTIHTQVEFPDPPPPPAAAPTSPAGVADDDLAQSTSTSTTQKNPSVEVLSNSMMLLDNFLGKFVFTFLHSTLPIKITPLKPNCLFVYFCLLNL